MANNSEKRFLPRLGEEYWQDIYAMKWFGFGIAIAIFGNSLVNSIFELIRNYQGGAISNEILVIIIVLSLCIILYPVYRIFQNFFLIKKLGKWGVTIVAKGSQSYLIGESFDISGTCVSKNQFVTIRMFKEKPVKTRVFETKVPIETDFQYHSSINTSGYEPGLYNIIAENDNDSRGTVSIILNDKKQV